ncbi:TrbI/VirB10 family protein [Candidatus Igneacidithiobacillus taiwanensis]|uniref:TrbI/VirB10 family protein n=1 Tax=Candidatus Igneacidithiobacillus taiwanensis TaxID=1945924 RepID=UPI00289CEF7C|nr:TrbI/VirB10 family protein [Candidatus Igneacidithiobacillus taiwanensis]
MNPFQFLMDARNRNVAKKAGKASGNSASGPNFNPTTGNAGINKKPSGDQLATRISRRPLYIAMGVLGVASYGGYLYFQNHDPFDHHTAKATTSVKPATASSIVPPATPKHKNHKPLAPNTNGGGTHPAAMTQSPAPAQSAPPGGVPQKNPWAAQDAAFQASLGTGASGGSSALTWKQNTSAATLQATQTAVTPSEAAQNALLAADKAAQQGKKHKKPVHDTSTTLVSREISPYEVLQGSVIPAVLETGIKSYLPGEITAVVSRNVYSSVNGATLLIPAGAKLVGTYNTATTLGVNRLMVAWTRIEFPNGTYINLPGFGASGGKGYAGFAGEVNDHNWLIFKNALLMSIVDAGMAIASPTSTSSNTTGVTGNQALQDSEQSLSQTFGQAEAELLQKYIDIAPTITVKPGYPFNVVATKDLVFPGPYNPAMQTGPGTVNPAVAPKPNPYG